MDASKSLQELEKQDWGAPENAPTSMVARCLRLRRVPLRELTAEDCRLLVGQQIGLRFVVPIAISFLASNPMEGGDMLPGTLLRHLLNLPDAFWKTNPDLWWQLKDIFRWIETVRQEIEVLTPRIEHCKGLDVG